MLTPRPPLGHAGPAFAWGASGPGRRGLLGCRSRATASAARLPALPEPRHDFCRAAPWVAEADAELVARDPPRCSSAVPGLAEWPAPLLAARPRFGRVISNGARTLRHRVAGCAATWRVGRPNRGRPVGNGAGHPAKPGRPLRQRRRSRVQSGSQRASNVSDHSPQLGAPLRQPNPPGRLSFTWAPACSRTSSPRSGPPPRQAPRPMAHTRPARW